MLGDFQEGVATLDIERGASADIQSQPWQTDTCIGQWFYYDGFKYKTPAEIVRYFVDVVSKYGVLLLNFPLRPDGTLDSQSESILCGCYEMDGHPQRMPPSVAPPGRNLEKVQHGSDEQVKWSLGEDGLHISRPQHNPTDLTLGFELS
jgi:alpha-L-fucosidase